jgi:hypothetical protein
VWQELKSMGEMKFMFQVRHAFVFQAVVLRSKRVREAGIHVLPLPGSCIQDAQ